MSREVMKMDIGKTALSPCKDCNNRWINTETLERCHSTCEKYLQYKQQLEVNRERYNEETKLSRSRFDDLLKWEMRKHNIKVQKKNKQKYKTC